MERFSCGSQIMVNNQLLLPVAMLIIMIKVNGLSIQKGIYTS